MSKRGPASEKKQERGKTGQKPINSIALYLFPPVGVGRTQAEAGAERDGGAAGAGASCELKRAFFFMREVEVEIFAVHFNLSLSFFQSSTPLKHYSRKSTAAATSPPNVP